MKKLLNSTAILLLITGCDPVQSQPSADQVEAARQEQVRQNQINQVGSPAIVNNTEKRSLKDLYELRDKAGVVTYTYIFSDMNACYRFLGVSEGFGIPYATQYTAPTHEGPYHYGYNNGGIVVNMLPQSEPNGLYPPASADGTWIKLVNPDNPMGSTTVAYIEPKISVFQFKLSADKLCK